MDNKIVLLCCSVNSRKSVISEKNMNNIWMLSKDIVYLCIQNENFETLIQDIKCYLLNPGNLNGSSINNCDEIWENLPFDEK